MAAVKGAALLLVLVTHDVIGTHFRGASMWWDGVHDDSKTAIIYYRPSWRRSYKNCYCNETTIAAGTVVGPPGSGYIMCATGCDVTSTQIGNTNFVCTDYSISEDVTTGVGNHTHPFPNPGKHILSWTGTGWLEGLHPHGDDVEWEMRMTLDLTRRQDTGQVNSSPRATMGAVMRMKSGCTITLPIPVVDPDGDIVRCRWAVNTDMECGGVCGELAGAVLDQERCSLQYVTPALSGYYAVSIQLEDYPRSAEPTGLSTPLSSAPLQFLVYVYSLAGSVPGQDCLSKPVFVAPTPAPNSCFYLGAGASYSATIAVQTKDLLTELREINTVSSVGMTRSGVRRRGNTHVYEMEVTWTPTSAQSGEKIFCFYATDTSGVASDQQCMYLSISLEPPKPISMSFNMTTQVVTIVFDQTVQRGSPGRLVRLYDSATQSAQTTFDVGNTAHVTVTDTYISFQLPAEHATQRVYFYINMDLGVVNSSQHCPLESLPVTDTKALEFSTTNQTITTTTTTITPTNTTTNTPPTESGNITVIPFTSAVGSGATDYTWLIVTIIGLVLLFALITVVAVFVRRKRNEGGKYPRQERQEEYARSIASKVSVNGAYTPDFNDIDVKFR